MTENVAAAAGKPDILKSALGNFNENAQKCNFCAGNLVSSCTQFFSFLCSPLQQPSIHIGTQYAIVYIHFCIHLKRQFKWKH